MVSGPKGVVFSGPTGKFAKVVVPVSRPHNSVVADVFLAVATGYALGNIPSADISTHIATLRNRSDDTPDLRLAGSENPGALNAGKVLGTSWGLAVFVADVLKGIVAAAIGRRIAGPNGANLASAAAVAGHCYPVSGRVGGKGVATSIGQVIGTFPRYLPLDIGVALGTAVLPKWTQRTWAATAVASSVWITGSTVAWRRSWPTGTDSPAPVGLPIGAILSSALIALRFAATPLVDGKPFRTDETGDR